MTSYKKQVFLTRHNEWADVLSEDDEWIIALNPVDGMKTMVDKDYVFHVRSVDADES